MGEIQEIVGREMRVRREDLCMTQEGMAEKVGITDRRYRDLEKGKGDVRFSTILRFAILCDMKLDPICETIREKGLIQPGEEIVPRKRRAPTWREKEEQEKQTPS